MRKDEREFWTLSAIIVGTLWLGFAVSKCAADEVVYTHRVMATDGSIVTTGSDGSKYHSRQQPTDNSWATEGTDVDGESVHATTRTQTDGSKVTTIRRNK